MPVVTKKPGRWDHPFDPDFAAEDLERLLALDLWAGMRREHPGKLEKLLRHDARLRRYRRGEIVVRRGDYGSSAFFIARGSVRVAVEGLSHADEGKLEPRRRGLWRSLAQLWRNHAEPEARDDPGQLAARGSEDDDYIPIILSDVDTVLGRHATALLESGAVFGEIAALGRTPRTATLFAEEDGTELLEIRWQGLRDLRKGFDGFRAHVDELFRRRALRQHLRATPIFDTVGDGPRIRGHIRAGELQELFVGCLGFQPSSADGEAGLKAVAESRDRSGNVRVEVWSRGDRPRTLAEREAFVQSLYERRPCQLVVVYGTDEPGPSLWQWVLIEPDDADPTPQPLECVVRAGREPKEVVRRLIRPLCIDAIADEAELASHGTFEWARKGTSPDQEPVIASEGQYADGVLLARCGFARVTRRVDGVEQTIDYLGPGRAYGFREIAHNHRRPDAPVPLQNTLRALGYVDLVVIPTFAVERFVLPSIPERDLPPLVDPDPPRGGERLDLLTGKGGKAAGGLVEFLVDNRFTNGTAAMVIDMDRCTRCDDCVRACASTHDGNPRFIRHGKQHGPYMIANACMHCADPVCMIGCPTGAISRESLGGQVVINDRTCIGCATCSNNCPYHNIRMVEARHADGQRFVGEKSKPILKATKCDLCIEQLGGPACQRACPHDALLRIDLTDVGALAEWDRR